MLPKTLIIGSTGYIGSALYRAVLEAHPDAGGLTRMNVDLAQPDLSGLDIAGAGYEWAVVAAAVPGLTYCEANPEETRKCNVDGTLLLVRQLADMDICSLWFSSDQVFDGMDGPHADDSPTHPVNEYGQQKAAVEARFADATDSRGLVVRLSKVYDIISDSGTLLDGMLANLKSGGTERAASDLVFCPTLLDDVTACVFRLMESGASGIANVAASPISRLELAYLAAEVAGVDAKQVEPMLMSDLNEPFARPGPVELIPSPKLEGYEFQDVRTSFLRLAGQPA